MKKVFYIGNFSFPYGNASGSRVLGNGLVLREIGYQVYYIGVDESIRSDQKLEDTLSIYKEFSYYNLPYPKKKSDWLSYKKRFREVERLLDKNNPDLIILYGSPTISIFCKLILNWARKNNTICLSDCVDWLNSGTGSIIYRTIKYLDNSYQKRIFNKQTDGVIAISTYLTDYYKKEKLTTITIPPLIDPDKYKNLTYKHEGDTKIKLIYVGQPFATDGRKVKETSFKDRLDKVINILNLLEEYDFEFNVYGITKNEYLKVIPKQKVKIENLSEKIFFHGKIKNNDAIKKISESHFTILFRDVNRMTSAGFPTKFVESISCGTPIITTNTSDIEDYLKEGVNGYFIDTFDQTKCLEKMKFIFSLNFSEIEKMKSLCKNSLMFGHNNFVEDFRHFMGVITK